MTAHYSRGEWDEDGPPQLPTGLRTHLGNGWLDKLSPRWFVAQVLIHKLNVKEKAERLRKTNEQ